MGQHEAQLGWERRFGRLAAAAAVGSLLLGLGAQVVLTSTASRSGGDRSALVKLNDNAGEVLAGTVLQALSAFLLAAVLLYLLRCVRYRRPEGVPAAIGPLILIAPLLTTVGILLNQLDVIDIADRFTSSGPRSESRADELLKDRSTALLFVTYAGYIALGFSLVMVNLNAMRAGLVTRFIGIIGIIVGALYVLPILAGPFIVQVFWLGALAAVFLGYWPGGRGEAWETGEAGVWLSAAEQRRQAMREDQAEPEPEPRPEREREPGPGPEPLGAEPEAAPHPVSRKRRRKRRR